MISYHTTRLVIERDVRAEEAALAIAAHCQSRPLLHEQATERVCLFFHGFTAGSCQTLRRLNAPCQCQI